MAYTLKNAKKVEGKWRGRLRKYSNVSGSGIGYERKAGVNTYRLCIVVFVDRKLPLNQLRHDEVIPESLEGIPTDVQQLVFSAEEDPNLYRPSPGGCSIGHYRITAGTLGSWAKFAGNWVILSNNHVIADSNNGAKGDQILQPGNYDGGKIPIAHLREWVPINFDSGGSLPPIPDCPIGDFFAKSLNKGSRLAGRETRLVSVQGRAFEDGNPNYVDAALADAFEPAEDVVRPEILEIGPLNPTPILEYFLGDGVQKRGRTTELTRGEVTIIDATLQVGYGNNKVATFSDQLIIEEEDGKDFSLGGDSGSLVVSLGKRPYGLLFAGGTDGAGRKVTVVNKISRVLEHFPGLEFPGEE